MFVAVAVPVLLLQPSLGGRAHAILLGACVCAAVGLLDDRFEIHPVAKLVGEVAAAAIAVSAGATIDHLTLPLLQPLDLGALQYPVTMLWIVALMNSFNFIDGMDGLAAGRRGDHRLDVRDPGALAQPRRRRRAGGRAGRRLPRVPALQLPSRARLHGRRRLAHARLPAGGDRGAGRAQDGCRGGPAVPDARVCSCRSSTPRSCCCTASSTGGRRGRPTPTTCTTASYAWATASAGRRWRSTPGARCSPAARWPCASCPGTRHNRCISARR